ncbi:MAG TPA: Rne/Rng family ribonuclease [Stellaceae bacterium]|nr:Rne/Rng family ribonuclease [Stellaceae bacterium]
MAKRMLIDATHSEETRVVVLDGNRLDEFDFETSTKKQVKGNIYLAKVTRVEPSLQAAFVEFGGNRHGFLAFSEIHPDYYRIPVGDRPHREQDHDGGDEAQHEPAGAPPEPQSNALEEGIAAAEERLPWDEEPAAPAVAAEPGGGSEDEPAEDGAADRGAVEPDPPAPAEDAPSAPAPAPLAAAEADAAAYPQAPAAGADTAEAAAPEPRSQAEASPHDVLTRAVPETTSSEAASAAETDAAAEAVEAAAEVAHEASMERAGEAHTIETVGGDEFEEAARQRSRSLRHYKIQEVIKRRQIMLVQVTKEERGNKGAALTTYLSLAGRYCVLMPNTARGGGVSRKITSVADRRRLKEILDDLDLPEGMGVIVRTAGSERSKAEIKRDLEYLLRLWDEIRNLTLQSTAPALIYEEGNLIKRSIRDLYTRDIDEVLVEGEEGYKTAKAFMKMLMPSHAKRVQPYRDPAIPLLHRFQVETQIDAIHSPVVQLRSGGYIVINPTEALVAIDVNSGRSTKERNIEETALRTNLEAAEEIARQLRLRDLAGLIVIDFIDMEEHRNQSAVERRLKDAMRHDRARIQLGRISPFGLLELSRQRLRPSLVEASTQPCPHCNGTGHIRSTESTALHVLRAIEEEGIRRRSAEICLYVPTNVALYILNQKREALAQIEQRYGFRVTLGRDDSLIPPAFRLERLRALTAAEAAAIPAAVAQIPPPAEIEEDEEAEAAEQAPSAAERPEAAGEEERGRRRRRRRRRRRPGEEHEAGFAHHPPPGAGEGEATEMAMSGHEAGAAHAEAAAAESAEAAPPGAAAEDEGAGRRRRRRGRRGGRRRMHGEAPAGGEDGHAPASASKPGAAPHAAADTIEIVPAPVGREDEPAEQSIAAAFSVSPVSVAEEAIGAASAPVADGADTRHGEASHQPPQPAEPPAGDAAPAEAGAGEAAPAAPSAETEPHPAPPGSGSTMPEPTLVTEKPANPKRGWWQRLMQS